MRKKIEKNFWDMEIIGNRRKNTISISQKLGLSKGCNKLSTSFNRKQLHLLLTFTEKEAFNQNLLTYFLARLQGLKEGASEFCNLGISQGIL